MENSEQNELLSNPKDPRFLKECFVCTENAKEGKYHLKNYGGIVCFSCRAFWRRSHQKTRSPMFSCKTGNKCVITPANRRKCQLCRYKRCLVAGMRPEAVLNEKQKRFHFRKLLQRQERQLARMRLLSGQLVKPPDTELTINYSIGVKRLVILETYDQIPHTQTSITYHPRWPVQNTEVGLTNDPCTLNDLQDIPIENLFFTSLQQDQVLQEDAVPSWTYL